MKNQCKGGDSLLNFVLSLNKEKCEEIEVQPECSCKQNKDNYESQQETPKPYLSPEHWFPTVHKLNRMDIAPYISAAFSSQWLTYKTIELDIIFYCI